MFPDKTKNVRLSLASAVVVSLSALGLVAGSAAAETVRLQATADAWISSFRGEQAFTAGKYQQFKIKSIQEMALVRFDAAAATGRQISGARLFLRRAGQDKLRYIRVSTVSSDWVEGSNAERLSAGDGASYLTATTIFADGGLMQSSVGL